MPEQLVTADGARIALEDDSERVFAAAMAAPPASDPEMPAPPKIDAGAPYGRKVDGTPKKAPGGRPPKARTVTSASTPPAAGTPKQDTGTAQGYARGIAEFLGSIQLALAMVPVPNEALRVRARYQSAVIEKTGEGLAQGLGMAAEHNGTIRWAVEKITQGGAAWVFPAAMAVLPFAASTAALWRAELTPELVAGADAIEQKAADEFKAMMADLDVTADVDAGRPAAA